MIGGRNKLRNAIPDRKTWEKRFKPDNSDKWHRRICYSARALPLA